LRGGAGDPVRTDRIRDWHAALQRTFRVGEDYRQFDAGKARAMREITAIKAAVDRGEWGTT
jgi:hypothetical protein